MIEIKIAENLKRICDGVALGSIRANVKLNESDAALRNKIETYCMELENSILLEEIASIPEINDTREAYKKLGKSPSRYRASSEALLRRVLQGKGLYYVNNIVDINNLISIMSKYSVGTYDLQKILLPVEFTIGEIGASYKGIGKDIINIEHLPVFSDLDGSFGSPTSDSERTMVTMDTTNILMNIISFSGIKTVEAHMELAVRLLEQHAAGKEIEAKIID